MNEAVIVLAHGGHGGGSMTWLLIPLVVVGFLVWRSNRRMGEEHTRRNLGRPPVEGSADQRVERSEVDSGDRGKG